MPANRLLYRVLAFDLLAVSATVAIASRFQQTQHQFGDSGFITYFSAIQLLIASFLACKVFQIRSQKMFILPWRSSSAIWLLISAGFCFLALDDLLMIHESTDKAIHAILRMQETGLSDRIDDVIVGLYGLLALGAFAAYRKELKRYLAALPFAVAAFVLLFAMVGVDIMTNRNDLLLTMFSLEQVIDIKSWIFVLEEGLKLLSEAFFIVAVHSCLQIAKRHTLTYRQTHLTMPVNAQNHIDRYS